MSDTRTDHLSDTLVPRARLNTIDFFHQPEFRAIPPILVLVLILVLVPTLTLTLVQILVPTLTHPDVVSQLSGAVLILLHQVDAVQVLQGNTVVALLVSRESGMWVESSGSRVRGWNHRHRHPDKAAMLHCELVCVCVCVCV